MTVVERERLEEGKASNTPNRLLFCQSTEVYSAESEWAIQAELSGYFTVPAPVINAVCAFFIGVREL